MRMGAWSMARVLRQRIEYYIYIYHYSLPVTLIVAVTCVDVINDVHSIVSVPAVTEAPGIVAVAVNMGFDSLKGEIEQFSLSDESIK